MLVALLMAFLIETQPPDRPEQAAEVAVETLDVLDEPDALGFVTGQLRRGDAVMVREAVGSGWLAIEPPKGSFGWIDQDAIEEDETGRAARVVAGRATIRTGRAGARMPGRPSRAVEEGETVRLLDRPPLRLRQGNATRTWRAIAPLAGDVRYIRASGVHRAGQAMPEDEAPDREEPERGEREEPAETPVSGRGSVPADEPERAAAPRAEPRGQVLRASERTEPLDRTLAMAGPAAGEAALAPALAGSIAQVEAMHRRELRRPVDQWNLEPVRQAYQALLERETDPAARSALGARLERVERQVALAQTARSVNALLARSHELDGRVAQTEKAVQPPSVTKPLPYDAEGLLQASSRMADGQTLFALIGTKGQTLGYLKLPPGLNGRAMLARKVGVRGAIQYNEALRSNLVTVRELDALSDPP